MAVRAAALTGVFCALFSFVVTALGPKLEMTALIGVSFMSGFMGSLFARFVLGRPLEKD